MALYPESAVSVTNSFDYVNSIYYYELKKLTTEILYSLFISQRRVLNNVTVQKPACIKVQVTNYLNPPGR